MKKFSFLSLAILVVGFCACISCSYFISNVLLSAGLFSNTNFVSTESQTVFAISMSDSATKEELNEGKLLLESQNGAGYIYKKDDKFCLLSSVYQNKADAELVKNNLSSQNVSCEILTIEIPAINISGNFSNEEKAVLMQCLKAKTETFKKLYDVAISLDTTLLDITKAKLECNQIYSSLISTKANFETMFKDKNLVQVETSLKTIESHLSNLISENFENENQTFSSLIKLTYCKILLE